jgi:hypothetical protein
VTTGVWSHWSRPLARRPGAGWPSDFHYVLSCFLSLQCGRQHFDRTVLVTDSPGKLLLVDQAGLEFDDVRLDLDGLQDVDPGWWVMGKVQAARTQTEPFIHIDNDAYLWAPLPDRLLNADVAAQNPEHFTDDSDYYHVNDLDSIMAYPFSWLPREIQWCRSVFGEFQRSFNTGIYGGRRLDFIHYCAELTFEIIEHPGNRLGMAEISDKTTMSGLLEMFTPAACLDYYATRPFSPFTDVQVETLFDSAESAFADDGASGYTHLIGRSKSKPSNVLKLLRRVERDYPATFSRCQDIFS